VPERERQGRTYACAVLCVSLRHAHSLTEPRFGWFVRSMSIERQSRGPLLLCAGGAVLGSVFAALSTNDFMQFLDRQVHAIHCSFIPGAAKEVAESGCRTVMMSPYSSFFREMIWGGIPVSLWALAVFAFIAYRAGLLAWRGEATSGETRFLTAACALPVAMSVIFGVLSMVKLEATCKVCVGIYASSALCFLGAALAHWRQGPRPFDPLSSSRFTVGFLEGVAFVVLVTAGYVLSVPKPNQKTSVEGCGTLVQADDPAGVMIPLVARSGGESAIEVLDPLCPSCKAFDLRLGASSLRQQLDLKGVLFPLDNACNWMVSEAIHPGACAVSEAVLCAAGVEGKAKNASAANAVLKWAFAHQEELRQMAARSDSALRDQIERQFPEVKGCLGKPLVKSKLTKSLRWAVANAIPVLTPQLFVGDSRMCDEDTDLGLEYTLGKMLSPAARQARAERRAKQPPPERAAEPSEPTAALGAEEKINVPEKVPLPPAAAAPEPKAAKEVSDEPASEPAPEPQETSPEEVQQ
jgi:uncharacterized membrane protein